MSSFQIPKNKILRFLINVVLVVGWFFIFVVIFSTSVIVLLWKLLSTQAKTREQYNSAPIDYGENLTNQNTINPVIQNDVPDPLDQEIDIPLM